MNRVKKNPNKSLTTIGEEVGVSRFTVKRVVKAAGGRSVRRRKIPLVSASGRRRRKKLAKGLLNNMKSAPPGRIIFFSDEKNFVVDPAFNPQNDRVVRFGTAAEADKAAAAAAENSSQGSDTAGDSIRPDVMPRSKNPASLMFFGVIASTGEVGPPVWFPQGFRLAAADYIDMLETTVIPWMREVAGNQPWVFQQDSAPAHRAKRTQDFLRAQGVDFWTPQQWPPNSPDLNPLDYAIWSYIEQEACKTRPASLALLRRRVTAAWRAAPAEKIRVFCARFRSRLERCVEANGSYFEK